MTTFCAACPVRQGQCPDCGTFWLIARRLPDEPATEAGRALLGMIHDEIDSTTFSEQEVCDHILAIEREAAAGALPSVVVDLLRDVEREFVPIYGPSESGTRVDLATAFREWLALAAPPEASER
jgi:hypothetical protein